MIHPAQHFHGGEPFLGWTREPISDIGGIVAERYHPKDSAIHAEFFERIRHSYIILHPIARCERVCLTIAEVFPKMGKILARCESVQKPLENHHLWAEENPR